ncbi:hypothetical protein ACOJVU_18725 [Mycobacterium sp. THU-M104]|uniref:hypothetical protein n=1 Tax=Mycobacterium sp. THU-M104 TaxID=3410515 RepID=UPI003B99C3BC
MWHTSWGFMWSAIVAFAFIAYLLILFSIIADLFWRDHSTTGWVKAVWVFFLVLFPYLAALVYLIVRGEDMTMRAREAATLVKRGSHAYFREVTGRSPAQEIAHGKELLDDGTITPDEFDTLKGKALD